MVFRSVSTNHIRTCAWSELVHMCVYGYAAVTGEGQTGYSCSSCYDCQLEIITEAHTLNPTALANAGKQPFPLTPPHAHKCFHLWENTETLFQAGNLHPTWRARDWLYRPVLCVTTMSSSCCPPVMLSFSTEQGKGCLPIKLLRLPKGLLPLTPSQFWGIGTK